MSNKTLWTILDSIVLVVFDVILLILVGFNLSVTGWISIFFIHVAYAAVLVAPVLLNERVSPLNITLDAFLSGYFLSEFVLGLFFVLLSGIISFQAPLVLQLLLLATASAMVVIALLKKSYSPANKLSSAELTSSSAASKSAENKRSSATPSVGYISRARARLKRISNETHDEDLQFSLAQLDDLLLLCPESNSAVNSIDQDILSLTNKLDIVLKEGDAGVLDSTLLQLTNLINQRNATLKSTQE